PGMRYGYRLGVVRNGTESFRGEAWVSVPGVPFSLTALGSPSLGAASFTLGLDRAGPVRVAVFDADGRLIADLMNAWMPIGMHPLRWEGRDAAGKLAPSGMYVVQARTGGRQVVSRITLLH